MTAQTGLFADDLPAHHYLEYKLKDTTTFDILKTQLISLWQSLASNKARELNAEHVVIGFGQAAWKQLAEQYLPVDFTNFVTVKSKHGHEAVATQADVWVWVRQENPGEALATAMAVDKHLSEQMHCCLDLPAMVYRESRDLTGFVDGIGNPAPENRPEAVLVPEGQAGAGGSICLTQQWVHNLPAFNLLDVHDQERVIGRTKVDAIELTGDDMPADSHVSRTDLKLDGEALKILRRSKPYGTVSQHGLYFVGFACKQYRLQKQLESMYGLSEDGLHDRLIEFSKAITGSYWFVPSVEQLDDVFA